MPVGGQPVPPGELHGAPRTRELIFTARLMGADEALHLALISRIAADPLAAARELAAQVGSMAPLTLRATKEGLRRLRVAAGAGVDDTDLVEWCYGSADFREGMEAFFAKRKPQWQGR
ncbi:MAG: enoyl-CoA hydratase-related protein [Burkholderiaceae bacterium]